MPTTAQHPYTRRTSRRIRSTKTPSPPSPLLPSPPPLEHQAPDSLEHRILTATDNQASNDLEHQLSTLRRQLTTLQSDLSTLRLQTLASPQAPFRHIFDAAATDPHVAATAFIKRCTHAPATALVDIAKLCLSAPVGRVGTGRALRAVAVLLCDEVLRKMPLNAHALCVKGEALLPFVHYGKNDPRAPRSVLQEAYFMFDTACKQGNTLATFLKGRWLLSMEPLHKDSSQARLGASCVKAAAQANCARALVFLAHRYEYPELDRTVSFAADLPKGKMMREKFILDFYKRAADRGDADALNDIGTSYAEGYGGLGKDFDSAVEYYVRAIEAGSLHAYDNLGTHYETGMGGKYPDRVDFTKALYYYRRGARERCPKCAYNLAAAHEEGMSGSLLRNTKKAERYYRHSLKLADDANDALTASKTLKDLVALYLTRIKLNAPESEAVLTARKRLSKYVNNQKMIDGMMTKVNKAVAAAAKSKPAALSKLLGDVNSKVITRHVKHLEQEAKSPKATSANVAMLHHVLGTSPVSESPEDAAETQARKRGRTTTRRSTGSANKRRRTSRRGGG